MADFTEHFEGPGGVIYSPASAHSKELAKWEMRPLDNGSVTQSMIDAARRAGVHHGAFDQQDYPKAMYHATQTPNGIKMDKDVEGRLAPMSAASEVEERNLMSRGWRASQAEAIAVVEAANQAAAVGDANRSFQDRRMSATARREAEAIENSTSRHLGEIPAAPIRKKPGPKPKQAITEG